jgi:D-alanyl-D-alanine carboxypeptidase
MSIVNVTEAAKRLVGPAAAIFLLAQSQSAIAAPVPAAHRNYVKGPYILADAQTGRVYEDYDALRPWYPASTSKLMTLYVVFRAIQSGAITFDLPVTITPHAAAEPPSKMGFKPGTVLTLENALKIMMVKSANDIAMAVAEAVGGSQDGFASRMNAEAQRLGMTRSQWVNPNGLPDPRQITTARDMAVLARALLNEFPQYRDYYRIPAIQFGGRIIKNYNPLLERYPGANGMKTGFICASGFNLIGSAQRNGREVIAVVFGEHSGKARAEHAAALLDEGLQATGGGLFGRPSTTLTSVTSGQAYTTPLDMRPFICEGKRATEAEDAPESSDPAVAAAPQQAVSHLGPPIYVGPPVPVSLVSVPPPPAKSGTDTAARTPRARPETPGSDAQPGMAEAFAPDAQASQAASKPAQAIGKAVGKPTPLRKLKSKASHASRRKRR